MTNRRLRAARNHHLVRRAGSRTGKIIGSLRRRHRAEESKAFLAKLDREVPADLEIHLACANYSTQKTAAIKTWLLVRPRFHLHFTLTGSSWRNPGRAAFRRTLDRHLEQRAETLRLGQDEILERLGGFMNRISDSGHWPHQRSRHLGHLSGTKPGLRRNRKPT
jgi:hypothetical protein